MQIYKVGRSKVLFIGLDSAEPELLLRWSREGALPNLARLWNESAWTTPATPPGMGNGAAWPSMFTGVNPGRHGRYYYVQFQPDTYEFSEFRIDENFRHPPLWQPLSEAGLRVAIIDVVRAPLTPDINGIQIADWMTHDRPAQPRSWPGAFINEIVSRYGEDPFQGNVDKTLHSSAKEIADWRDLLIDRIRRKTAMSLDIFQREPWDLFMTVYADPHDVGHAFWHLHDAHHPRYDAKWAARYGDPVKDVYVELDRAIGEWAKLAGNHSNLVVFAAPGMGPDYTANGAMNDLLSRIERFVDTGKPGPETLYWARQAYRMLVPPAMRRSFFSMRHVLNGIATPLRKEGLRPPLSHRKFFALPHNENAGAIRFNVRGRESYGVVEPGTQFAALRQRVIDELCRIINEESGRPVVEKVICTDQIYHGPQTQLLPDVFVVWNRDTPIRRLISPSIGNIEVPTLSPRTGDHTPNSIFMVRIVNGSSSGLIPGESRMEDIAPTIAGMLGVQLADVDGTVVPWMMPSDRA
jgi:predicted AlkP superfamily phosphohydrolase/phosphomutase